MANVWNDLKNEFRGSDVLMRLILINTVVFLIANLLLLVLQPSEANLHWENTDFYLASSASGRYLLFHPWTIITHLFAHIDFQHWLSNMIALYFSGVLFLRFFDWTRLLTIYLVGGITGFIVYLIAFNVVPTLNPSGTILGASAAIMAILLSIAAYDPNMEIRLFGLLTTRLKYVAAIYVIYDFVSLRAGWNSGGHLAHLGGALYGFIWARRARAGLFTMAPAEHVVRRIFGGSAARGMRVVKGSRRDGKKTDEEYNLEKKDKQKRIDTILDKISRSGYDSLSKEERDFLFKYSQK